MSWRWWTIATVTALILALPAEARPTGQVRARSGRSRHAPPRAERESATPAAAPGRERTNDSPRRGVAAPQKPRPTVEAVKRAERHRGPAKHATARRERRCQHAAVKLERAELHESSVVALTDCDGHPRREAQIALSSLARLRGTAKPRPADFVDAADDGEVVDRGVALMHHGLVERLQRIVDRFPGRTVSIVSGFRPQSDGSMHQRGRAMDIHLDGVDNVALVELCKTFEDTGCGYYPNSSFVHVDVRPQGTGKVTWIDASGPGEKPRYVTSWPPAKCDLAAEPSSSTGDDPYAENVGAGAPGDPGDAAAQ